MSLTEVGIITVGLFYIYENVMKEGLKINELIDK